MAEKSGFFNALLTDGEYDRKYNANDYSDNLAVVISNGVLRSTNDDLKVTANGLVISVATGRGWIYGHWYHNDSIKTFAAITAPTSGNRYDRVVLRFDNTLNERKISLEYLQGVAANTPTKPVITRTNAIYDLVLADIYIQANATTVTVTDTRADSSVCGWVYSTSGDSSFLTSIDNSFKEWFQEKKETLASVTLFKCYNWRSVLTAASSSVAFNIPQYDVNTCFIEVFVNGILETLTTDYTVNGSVVTFKGILTAGTEVEVKVYKSVDGTGIQSVSGEITQLQNQYATLSGVSNYTYICTGLNDNVSLSQIAKAIYSGSYIADDVTTAANQFLTALGGNTYLANFPSNGQITIDVVGVLGATTAVSGTGTASARYKYFDFYDETVSEKTVIFDFGKCQRIEIPCAANTDNIIFYGHKIYIKNANVSVTSSGAGCNVTMIVGDSQYADIEINESRLKIVTTGKAVIAQYGEFTNCHLHCKSTANNAYCIDGVSSGVAKIIGGELYAYVGSQSYVSAVFNTESTETTAKIIAFNISCLTVEQSGFYQRYLCNSNGGMIYINAVVTALANAGSASKRNIVQMI